MKNMIIGFTFVLVSVYMFLIHSCIMAKDVRQNELDLSLNSAIRTTMEQTYTTKTEQTITTNEQLMDTFNNNFLTQLQSDADIEVQFMGVDVKDGLLDVKVVSKFKYPYKTTEHPDGVPGKIESRRTIVLDTLSNTTKN